MRKIILTAASTGNKRQKTETPYIPITPEEIIADGLTAVAAGATMLHIHARGSDGWGTPDPSWYRPQFDAYREQCPGVVLQLSTGIANGRAKTCLGPLLALQPDLASFNIQGNQSELETVAELFTEYQVAPMVECFCLSDLHTALNLLDKGLLKPPVFFELVFDIRDDGTPLVSLSRMLLDICSELPEGSIWSQTGGASRQRSLQALAVSLGGGVRAGLEDRIWLSPGVLAKNSGELVAQAGEIVCAVGGSVATLEETRSMLGLCKTE